MDFVRCNRLRPGILAGGALLLGGIWLAAPQARAALGAGAASIADDQAHLRATATLTTHPLYEVHELTLPAGTIVREYTAADGGVFAIGWNGPAMPDLQQTLGRHFADYVAAASANASGHHYMAAQSADLVVVSTGRMRAFAGHAYLASAVPAGVSTGELQ